jgi:hypothetical protein
MRERPIIFAADSVRAILAGTKTQTRRVLSRRLPVDFVGGGGDRDDLSCWGYWVDDMYGRWAVLARGLDQRHAHGHVSIPCPYGKPGDRLYVKESWAINEPPSGWLYRADDLSDYYRSRGLLKRWSSPLHMPRYASRITLELTDVRVQRLQEISPEDAIAEGIVFARCDCDSTKGPRCAYDAHDAVRAFAEKWDEINGKRAPWASNPWVWALTFARVTEPR